ncbi:MAG: HIT family protein [Chitinophagales bacterium]|jgi:histidine triad (HIT) family protein|nr:HIT family protein [Chitinophagales bacterium]
MASIFSKIIRGELPAYKIYEDNDFIAFLDIQPLVLGHTLLVPKLEIDKIWDLPSDILSRYMPIAQQISAAIDKACPCSRVGVVVMGLEVPHAHMHLIPMNHPNDLDFRRPKLSLNQEEMTEIQQKLINLLPI